MKKTACWILIFSMLVLLALPAAAAEERTGFADADAIRNTAAVQMLADLSLIVGDQNGDFRPDAPITRAETAKLIAFLCTDTPESEGWAAFADTAGSWAKDYIAYCASKGIVGGSGGYFRPQDDVTAQELAKMLLIVTGSDEQRYTGAGWSQRVNADAQETGIYHGFAADPAEPITRDDACLLIYNAMQRPAVDGTNDDGTPRYVLDGLMNRRTFLEVRFDAVRYSGTLTGNECADLTHSGSRLDTGATKLEGHKEFAVSSELALVGHSVDVYMRGGEIIGAPSVSVQEKTVTVFDTAQFEAQCRENGIMMTPETRYYRNYSETTAAVLDALGADTVVIVIDRGANGWADAVLVLNGDTAEVSSVSPLRVQGTANVRLFSSAAVPQEGDTVFCLSLGGATYILPKN